MIAAAVGKAGGAERAASQDDFRAVGEASGVFRAGSAAAGIVRDAGDAQSSVDFLANDRIHSGQDGQQFLVGNVVIVAAGCAGADIRDAGGAGKIPVRTVICAGGRLFPRGLSAIRMEDLAGIRLGMRAVAGVVILFEADVAFGNAAPPQKIDGTFGSLGVIENVGCRQSGLLGRHRARALASHAPRQG